MKAQSEIKKLKDRNKRVEIDKSWETSKTRKSLIAALTYFVIVIFLYVIQVPKPWINAIIPTIGFLLSTLTLKFFKKIWMKKYFK